MLRANIHIICATAKLTREHRMIDIHMCCEGPKRVKKRTRETVSTPLKYTFKTINFHNMKILWLGV